VHTLVTHWHCAPGLAQPIDQARVAHLAARALAARHEHHVEGRRVVEAVLGEHAQALRAADRAGFFGDRDDPPGRRRGGEQGGEDFPGSDEVELFDVPTSCSCSVRSRAAACSRCARS
jgi:hypothetical protein